MNETNNQIYLKNQQQHQLKYGRNKLEKLDKYRMTNNETEEVTPR
jgi:hypothetical protein